MKKTSSYIYNKVRAIDRWLLSLVILFVLPLTTWADDIPIRYVKTTGTYGADGLHWSTAMNDVQEAIEDLYSYMTKNQLTEGYVYVAAGTYYPSRSTETNNENRQHLSFIIYPGIHVYGGFAADLTDADDGIDPNGKLNSDPTKDARPHKELSSLGTSQSGIQQPWNLQNETILSGSLAKKEPDITYDAARGTYKTIFYENSYHVVWFATNGFIEPSQDVNYGWDETSLTGHARALKQPASIDGCTIRGGYAATKANTGHPHTAYGAGVYMVEGASLVNCIVKECLAMSNGGGVYMDGGGLVDKCYIHTCQATGQNALQGFGGGVCINFDGAVTRSYIANNSSRSGGGVAICHLSNEYPWHSRAKEDEVPAQQINKMQINDYSPHVTACIISNNSSTYEAGGIYLNNGGVVNHLTVTNNQCFGSDVTYYGRRQARSGGIYILNGGQVYNSVFWGNKCEVNNDNQYACHTTGSTETLKPQVYYSAFANHETTDWSGTTQTNVYSLASNNINTAGNNACYPYFIGTTGTGDAVTEVGAGLGLGEDPVAIPRPITWKPAAISGLAEKGVQVTDALSGASEWIKHAHTETDMLGYEYEPVSSLGALVRREEKIASTLVKNQEIELYREAGYTSADAYTSGIGDAASPTNFLPDDGSLQEIPTIFVDPLRKLTEKNSEGPATPIINIGQEGLGSNWTTPCAHINDAIHYFRGRQWKKGTANEFQYNIGGTSDGSGGFTGGTNYPYVQILVKGAEGTAVTTTVGLDAYLGEELRTAAIRPCSNMRIYGGYPTDLTETNTGRGNLRGHYTRVTANAINGSYQNNSAHVFALTNVKNVIIDGFEIYFGNANLNAEHSYAPIDPITGEREAIAYGGGLILNNASALPADRIDMTGNILRNSIIAHCSAPDGAAIYVNAGNKDGTDNYCKAELNIINTIIRNNTVGDGTDVTQGEGGGIVSARGEKAKIRMDHCDLVNNCGYPMETLSDGEGGEGYIYIYNSVIYANGKELRSNRKNIVQPLCYNGTSSHFKYDYIHLDWDARTPVPPTENVKEIYCRDMSEHYQKWASRRVDANDRTLLKPDGSAWKLFNLNKEDLEAEIASSGYNDWTEPIYLEYPFFVNPAKNVGHSEEGDKPMNGGSIDYMPQATNPMVNAAIAASSNLWDGDNIARTRGGDPDIGAVESTDLPVGGSVIYVTPDGAGRRDGSSWDNAIAGNTVYVLDNVAGPALATGDQIDSEPTCDRVLDANGDPVLTTDDKYCGGFGRVWMTEKKTGATTTSTETETWKKVYHMYIDGPDQTESPTLFYEDETPEITEEINITSEGSSEDGFVAGWSYDPRYPYGEISGASRSFWRANPYHDGTDWNNAANYANANAFRNAVNENGWINNLRQERYVSGLQYAVEKAAAYNALAEDDPGRVAGVDSVIVWISNGTFTDYKGYVMRDNTTVKGSFPAVKNGAVLTPGMNERQALMSNVVNIPKSKQAKDFDPVDYETILQISNVNPKQDNENLNMQAVNAWDDDIVLLESTDTRTTKRVDLTITEYYTWKDQEDVSTTYIRYPDMLYSAPSTNVFSQRHKTDYTAPKGPNNDKVPSSGVDWNNNEKYVYQYFGQGKDGNNSWELVYANRTNNVDYTSFQFNGDRNVVNESGTEIGTVQRGMQLKGAMVKMSVWQTMKNVPQGTYQVQVDMGAYYKNNTSKSETGVTFYVINNAGTICVSSPIYCEPNNLRRYTFNIIQPSTGDLTIRMMAEPGTEAEDQGNLPAIDNNPNCRIVSMANVHLLKMLDNPDYVKTNTTESSTETSSSPVTSPLVSSTAITHRTALRKRVLTMPDKCITTYGTGSVGDPSIVAPGKLGDSFCHSERTKGSAVETLRTSGKDGKYTDPGYIVYTDVFWDGFTIRHGFIFDEGMVHGGGAGVNMYEGGHLQNCIVIDNMASCSRIKGGGVFCDGATSTIEGCFILNNTATKGTVVTQNQIFAGGMFMYEGTCFNSLIAKNYSYGSGGGMGLCVGRFFNNTVAYNECGNISDKSEGYAGGGIAIATGAASNLFMANTIIYGNNGTAFRERNYNGGITASMLNPFIHCFIQSEVEMTSPAFLPHLKSHTEDEAYYGVGNTFTDLNGVTANSNNSPFAADKERFGKAKEDNDFRLDSSVSSCINSGTTDFAGAILQALLYKGGKSEAQIKNSDFYKNVAAAVMPQNDVVFAKREQDCQIDVGAYEYDAVMAIHPGYEMIDFADEDGNVAKELCAVYYVTQNGNSAGDSSGSSPENAACATKLQDVLDAAGRLKYDLKIGSREFSTDVIDLSVQVQPLEEHTYTENSTIKVKQIKHGQTLNEDGTVSGEATSMSLTGENGVKHVIVKLADGVYMPDRSTNNSMVTGESEDEILTHSLIIPHGVEVWGGYQFKNDSDDPTDFFEYTRDVLNHKSIFLSGVENSSTGSIGKAYHVVSFSNHLYDPITGEIYNRDGLQGENKLKDIFSSNPEQNRAILDGLYIQEGEANGVNEEDKYGGAGVVTGYAHIRNCIIQDNMATKQGGGLYLLPGALVSGCIFKDNTADEGGAIYVVEPETDVKTRPDADYARVYNSTIINNTAGMKGGGIFFDTNIRAKGVVLWQNTANDMNDVAGTFDSEAIQEQQNYPFSYCAVQNRRLPGVNNKEISGESSLGVRWNAATSPSYWTGESSTDNVITIQDGKYEYKDFNGFYYIDRVSALVRQGMPYVMYNELRKKYVSLELADIAGVYRMEYEPDPDLKGADYKNYFGESNELVTKNNKYMEIGARALNTQMDLDVENSNYHMTRLFVAKSEDINSSNANILLTSGDPLYSQQGSSMANPFTKFSDALDYIVKLRNYKNSLASTDEGYEEAAKIRKKYANTRFEIFVAGGEYYPYQNPLGVEGNARSSTFVLPEGVTIIGGLRPDRMYCQAGYEFDKNQHVPEGEVTDEEKNDRTKILDDREEEITNPGITLVGMETDNIREARLRNDVNENNVFEPWEFEKESIFSGNTPRGNENEDNVFHVFTCFADPDYVGTLPTRYSNEECSSELTGNTGSESDESLRRRMIILDGVTVKEGNARDYEEDAINNIKMFYRGGGIMVDGSWTKAELDSDENDADAKGSRDIPLIISSCMFQDNNAIQGGAIFTNGTLNVFSSSFVQNYARGPVNNVNQNSADRTTALDVIKYVGGGAIATTNDLLCVNTIFANNEAMLGDSKDLLAEGNTPGINQQGFGGVIWGGSNSNVKLLNCNLVNNQAVSYPGVYLKSYNTSNNMHHFCVNTVFWGNKATGVPSNLNRYFSNITEISDDVVKFRTMAEKRNQITPQGVETLYFCAYEEGKGPQDVKAAENITYGGEEYEPHAIPYEGVSANIRNSFRIGDTYYNNNVIITSANEGVDGPNFLRPSNAPGRDGYSADANWMASRVNKLTDNGWSYLTVAPDDDDEMRFKIETETGKKAFEITPDNETSGGVFNWNAYKVNDRFHLNLMPLGSIDLSDPDHPRNYYMKFNGTGMTDQMTTGGQSYMQRISSNPLSRNEYEAYIDIGVYEYQHRTLKINQGSEIDVIWITDTENPEAGNDGYSWETATSNVQVAIETLLKSRNNHGKRLNIIAGSYKPMTVINDNLGYTLQTSAYNDGVYTPFINDEGTTEDDAEPYGVKYIHLRGGYDKEVPDEIGFNYQKNQVVFSMEQRTGVNEDALNHILNIADIEQFTTKVWPDRWDYDEEMNLVPVHFSKKSESTGNAIPVIIEGITFENTFAQAESETNKGGAAISYKTQYRHVPVTVFNEETQEYEVVKDKYVIDENQILGPPEDGSPKLTIRNCTFAQNSKEVSDSETPASAIRIEGGAGKALIVNSVFHSNKGKPVDAENTVVLNCTSAMNGGHITLTGDESEMHNSVIWQDDQRASTDKKQFEVPAGMCIYNGSTPEMTVKMTYNAISGLPKGVDARYNEPLSDTNNDLEEGPNFLFMNPNDEDPTKRDFRIRPSLKLLDRGNNAVYAGFVWPDYPNAEDYLSLMRNTHNDQKILQENLTTIIREGNETREIHYSALKCEKDLDRAFNTRLLNENIDRGAYECTGRGQRVLYVNPEKFGTGLESGSTWEDALGRGNLQRAIDAAAVYVRNHGSAENSKAYVFVRGDNVYNEGEITIRDGVSVYGTAPITIEAKPIDKTADLLEYTENELKAYVNRVKAERSGIAFKSLKAESFTPTYCSGLVSMGDYKLGSVFDGLLINNGSDNIADRPVVDIKDDAKVAIRNCIIIHNNVGKDKNGDPQPVVNLGGGLLYNSLIYDGLGGDVVRVGENGYVLNCTVIADGTRQKAVTYAGGTGDYDGHVKNTIAVNEGGSQKMFAPYMHEGANAYTPASHLTTHRPYWYQLHEKSTEIDHATLNSNDDVYGWLPILTTTIDADNTSYDINFDQYVDIEHDRDLLGNPRKINSAVDNGCFETWRVNEGTELRTDIRTNGKADEDAYVTDEDATNYYTENAGGNLYPHAGSVVYIEKDAKLILDKIGDDLMFTEESPWLPGYLLVEEGGSLYGQGNHVTAHYVAVEKTVNGQYSLVSVPYMCNPNSTVAISYSDGAVVQTQSAGLTGSIYDGEKRSQWDYHYKVEDSDCWIPQNDFIPANTGWLLSLGESFSNTTFRFTGWSESETSYIYTEDGHDKTVTLTQYNDLPEGGSAHFTKEENMGWNLTGLPWLVSNYSTSTYDGTEKTYQMNVPHVFYSNLDKRLSNPATGNYTDGQFYATQSWVDGVLSPAVGFFTQTAVLGESEELTFKQPVIGSGGARPRQRVGISHQSGSTTRSAQNMRFDDVMDVYPQEGADAALNYRLGSDGIKWMAFNPSIAQIYVQNAVGTRLSLVSAAPVETDINLGVKVPEAGDYVISLPEPEAYSAYAEVWLIDQQTGQKVNLKEDNYLLTVSEAGDFSDRLKLRFGGAKGEQMMTEKTAQSILKVTARNGRIPLRGIGDYEQIKVFTAGGTLIYSGPASDIGQKYLTDGIYIIRRE